MFFMKFPIGAVFLVTERSPRLSESEAGGTDLPTGRQAQNKHIYKVVKISNNIKPWHMTPLVWKADSVLEVKSGILKKKDLVLLNDQLACIE